MKRYILGCLTTSLMTGVLIVGLSRYFELDVRMNHASPVCSLSRLEEVRVDNWGYPCVIWHGIISPKTITALPIYTIIVDAGEDSRLTAEKIYQAWRLVRDDVRSPSPGIGEWKGKYVITLPCEVTPSYRQEAKALRTYRQLFGELKVTVTT